MAGKSGSVYTVAVWVVGIAVALCLIGWAANGFE